MGERKGKGELGRDKRKGKGRGCWERMKMEGIRREGEKLKKKVKLEKGREGEERRGRMRREVWRKGE